MNGEKFWDELWIGVKVLPNLSISGSHRNAFRGSVVLIAGGGRATDWDGGEQSYPT